MFFATALVYPCVLAVLCAGAGLLVDRISGSVTLPAALLLTVGAAALIGLSQLTTYVSGLAPATPYLMALAAAAGLLLGRARARELFARARASWWQLAMPVIAYAVALAPVLVSGRASFSSFLALGDSAFHMMGADFLLRHGQDYSHLDLRNSYGQFINNYYNTSYPSGADTLFGASAFLLRLPLIWTFQPFNAFMLAIASGPAWLLARRMRLDGAWAGLAALTAVLGALVYGYELIGSIKEVTSLSMILTLGTLVVMHRRWLRAAPGAAIPFALVAAAGVSALGVAFSVWGLVAVVILAVVAAGEIRAGRLTPSRLLGLTAAGALVALIAAWPTWIHVSGSLQVAKAIASTSNPGNLRTSPLRVTQVFGVWLNGSYKQSPRGGSLLLTRALILLMFLSAVAGAVQLLRTRRFALAGWFAGALLAWLVVTEAVTTWAMAKTLMLTSPEVVLLAWGGLAALLRPRPGAGRAPAWSIAWMAACALALAITAGVLVSDGLQYHDSNLAPTARYQELASVNSRFAGKGPTLFTDFDEYAMYELRDLDIGGPNFAYPPPTLRTIAAGYGDPVELDRAQPQALLAYPLIVTRRDPAASRPPAAYRLAWQGDYYQVWSRQPRARAAIAHVGLTGSPAAQCSQIQRLAKHAGARPGARLIAADSPALVKISLAHAAYTPRWGRVRRVGGLEMRQPGRLAAGFTLPSAGVWNVWVQGNIMPTIHLGVDGRPLASIAGQVSGLPDTAPPIPVRLSAGHHRLSLQRFAAPLTPGDGGWAVLKGIFLTPAKAPAQGALSTVAAANWRSLCDGRYQWVELLAS